MAGVSIPPRLQIATAVTMTLRGGRVQGGRDDVSSFICQVLVVVLRHAEVDPDGLQFIRD